MSVVIPAHNAAATIGDQLAALARQDYAGAWEVVVTDNGSIDDTAQCALASGDRLPSLRVVAPATRAGSTPSLARNTGAAAAAGEFLAYCDADDIVTDGWLTALVDGAEHADIVAGPVELEALNDPVVQGWLRWAPPADHLPNLLGFLPAAFGSSLGVWRAVLENVGGWNEAYTRYDDLELSWRVQLAGYRLAIAPGALVHYRLRSSFSAIWRKGYLDGQTEARLFREFHPHGMPRTDTRRALRLWAGRARHLPQLLPTLTRGFYLHITAMHLGRLVGSVRQGTLYL